MTLLPPAAGLPGQQQGRPRRLRGPRVQGRLRRARQPSHRGEEEEDQASHAVYSPPSFLSFSFREKMAPQKNLVVTLLLPKLHVLRKWLIGWADASCSELGTCGIFSFFQ